MLNKINPHLSESERKYFFLLGGQKMNLLALRGAIKTTLWPDSRKHYFIFDSDKCGFILLSSLINIITDNLKS